MSEPHVRQLEAHLKKTYSGIIDLNDVSSKPQQEQKPFFLTRALAAYALGLLSTQQVIAAHIVDGFNDNGIDALLPDLSAKRLYLVQSKWITSGKGEPGVGEISKFTKGIEDLIDCAFQRFNSRLVPWHKDIRDLLLDARLEVHACAVYTGDSFAQHSERVVEDLSSAYNDVSDLIFFRTIKLRDLHRSLVTQVKGTSIDADVVLYNWGMIEDQPAAYYGHMLGSELQALWAAHGNSLFAENLRSFMPSTEVNAAITKTLISEPQRFFYLNNGLTILARSAKKKPMGSGSNKVGAFACEGISIINGAQTLGCIGSLPTSHRGNLAGVKVLCKIVSLGDTEEEFPDVVTRACNTQNTILPKDFAALDDQQKRLEIDFKLIGKKYAYRSGDTSPLPSEGLTLEEAAVALACRDADTSLATLAKREVGRLWADTKKRPYTVLFTDSLSASELWNLVSFMRVVDSALIQAAIDSAWASLPIAVHANRFVLHIMFQLFKGRVQDLQLLEPGVVAEVTNTLARVVQSIELIRAQRFPGYLQSLFKNQSKTKEFAGLVLASLAQKDGQGLLFPLEGG